MIKELFLKTIALFLLTWLYGYALSKDAWLSVIISAWAAVASIIGYYIRKDVGLKK
jgi:hypothetical protein